MLVGLRMKSAKPLISKFRAGDDCASVVSDGHHVDSFLVDLLLTWLYRFICTTQHRESGSCALIVMSSQAAGRSKLAI